jgi:hypothetical protein
MWHFFAFLWLLLSLDVSAQQPAQQTDTNPSPSGSSQQTLNVETTTIKGNTELPKFLYVVPWQEKRSKSSDTQKVVIHNIYGDLFDPVLPERITPAATPTNSQK